MAEERSREHEAEIADRVEELLTQPVAALGCDLLEVQYRFQGKWILRLVVDRVEGVGLDECAAVSEVAGRILDVEDPVPTTFSLEVSSPGLFRPLKTARHFRQSIGKVARLGVVMEEADECSHRMLRHTIKDVLDDSKLRDGGVNEGGGGDVTVVLDAEGATLEIPLRAIRSARLDPDL